MKIIAGEFRNQNLNAPKVKNTRPTSARVRENIFNIIEHNNNIKQWNNQRILDLFAGSGMLGFEAMSRGAQFCLFVEINTQARATIRHNIHKLNLTNKTAIFKRDAVNLRKCAPLKPFNIIFADPPYQNHNTEKTIHNLIKGGWCEKNAIIILEEIKNAPNISLQNLIIKTQRIYGNTKITLFEKND